MLFGPLRIESNTLSSISHFSVTRNAFRKRVSEAVDSLVESTLKNFYYFYCPHSKISKKLSDFIVFRFLKNRENSVFGTKIVPTTSELNLTGSTYYSSAITM